MQRTGITFGQAVTAATSGATSIVVPVDVEDVDDAYILLNDYFGVSSATYQVNLNFTFNGGSSTDTFNLTSGTNIESAVQCGSTKSPSWTGTGNCTTYAQSTSSSNTDTAWSANYSNSSVNQTPYSGTSGNLVLSDLTFDISGFAGDELDTITITENNNLANSSKLGLSAITVAGAEVGSYTGALDNSSFPCRLGFCRLHGVAAKGALLKSVCFVRFFKAEWLAV